MRSLQWQARRPPKEDDVLTGVTFVDVLFALVVGKILDVSTAGALEPASIAHLVLGSVLTIASWVGYHNSVNRVRYFLRFWNLPTFLFAIDILLVYAYWLLPVITVQYEHLGSHTQPEALRATALVVAAAGLYVTWDYLALWLRKVRQYEGRPISQDIPERRYTTIGLFVSTLIVLGVVLWKQPKTDAAVITVDTVLIAFLLAYRTVKEALTRPDALT